jgi:hypothetical protein
MAPQERPDIEALVLAIARSPIVLARAAAPKPLTREAFRFALPEGFDDTDVAVLRWISEEARRVGRRLARN